MRDPDFWRTDGIRARIAAPLGAAYAAASRFRYSRRTPRRVAVPVVCIGNLVVGGAGKTPVAAAIGAELRRRGIDAHFLSRGFGGRNHGPVRVEPGAHDAGEVGDEPLLLAEIAPTWVARDRVAGAEAAIAAGAGAIVMDDGYQNPSLVKDLAVVVVDGGYGLGNRRVMPAGPLREPWGPGLARADWVILIGDDATGIAAELRAVVPLVRARLVPAPGAERIAGKDVVAFAGIARPEKFFLTLGEMGCRLREARRFADHHVYRADEIMELVETAAAAGAIPVTTAKDAARMTPEIRPMVEVLDIAPEWDDDGAPARLLAPILDRVAAGTDA